MPRKSLARKSFGIYKGHQHPVRRAIRHNLRALRLASHMSSYALGEKLGVSQAYLSELESPHEDKAPDVFMLTRIAEVFKIPVHTMLIENFYNGGVDLDQPLNDMTAKDKDRLCRAMEATVDAAIARLN